MTVLWIVIAAAYGIMSLITFGAFVLDKRKAERGRWRIKEKTLISLAICCGWPGAMLGMKLARHKTRKPLFKLGIPAIAVLHVAALAGLAWVLLGR
ncbi:MAG: DUF1294 domain-containing protein [Planctomycetota bacterium]